MQTPIENKTKPAAENSPQRASVSRREFVGAGAAGAVVLAGAGATAVLAQGANSPTELPVTVKLVQPLTEALRQTVREDFPELVSETWVSEDLRKKALEAMTISLAMSSFKRWSDVPGWAIPHVAEYGPQAGDALNPPGTGQPVHLRLTAMFAKSICETMTKFSKEVDINKEVAFIGALIHDIGKTFESDPVNAARWEKDPSRFGNPSMRHPNWGLIPATLAGLPESILHCIQAHSYEGNLMQRSLEGFVVYHADLLAWLMPVQSGIMVTESLQGPAAKAMIDSVNLKVNPRAPLGAGPQVRDTIKTIQDELKVYGHTPVC